MTFGLGAEGRAGNASAPLAAGRAEVAGVLEEERLGVLVNDGRVREGGGAAAAQGVEDEAPARREEEPPGAERGGKGLDEADGKAPLLPTAERED